uniref:Uncharacterized protein n=1 Tax=Arundo donax TaxID=35708 RepID=A0A0A8ZTP9_ARUDO
MGKQPPSTGFRLVVVLTIYRRGGFQWYYL